METRCRFGVNSAWLTLEQSSPCCRCYFRPNGMSIGNVPARINVEWWQSSPWSDLIGWSLFTAVWTTLTDSGLCHNPCSPSHIIMANCRYGKSPNETANQVAMSLLARINSRLHWTRLYRPSVVALWIPNLFSTLGPCRFPPEGRLAVLPVGPVQSTANTSWILREPNRPAKE